MTRSKEHTKIGDKLESIKTISKNLEEFKQNLKRNRIYFEEYQLANGKELLVFTGSSGYDIIGYSIRQQNRIITIEEIMDG